MMPALEMTWLFFRGLLGSCMCAAPISGGEQALGESSPAVRGRGFQSQVRASSVHL